MPAPPSQPGTGTFNHFHTARWMDKQERAFVVWLNHRLLPAYITGDGAHGRGGFQVTTRSGLLGCSRRAVCSEQHGIPTRLQCGSVRQLLVGCARSS